MGLQQDVLKKMKSAAASGGGNPIKQGKGRFIVKKITVEKKFKGYTFIAELYTKASDSYEGAVNNEDRKSPEYANPVGSSPSYTQVIDRFANSSGNVRAFLAKLSGEEILLTDDDEYGKFLEMATNDDPASGEVNPCRGWEIDYETYQGENKGTVNAANKGKPLTLVKFKSVEIPPEQVQANRNFLDGKQAPAAPAA